MRPMGPCQDAVPRQRRSGGYARAMGAPGGQILDRSRLLACAAIASVCALVLSASIATAAAPGDLDTSFSGDGKQTLNFGGQDRGTHVAITPDGRIVVVGSTDAVGGGDFAVGRFTSDGTPDATFGSGGKVTLGTAAADTGGGVVVLPDERIVVSGQGYATQDFVTKRLNADGSPDTSFTGAGTSIVDFGGNDAVNAMVQQPDGKLVLVGSTSVGGDFAIARLNADGTPDTTFSGDGRQTVDFGGGGDVAFSVAIAPDGKILVAGKGGGAISDMVVARLNADGSLDSTFGAGASAKASIDFGGSDAANGVALQPDGKIVMAGTTTAGDGDLAVARLNADGSMDTSFSGDGKLTAGYGAANELGLALAIQQNGRIVILGTGDVNSDFLVLRLAPDGTPDASFGNGGTVAVDFGGAEFDGDVALQPDGQIVVAGSTNNATDASDVAVARLQGDPVAAPAPGAGAGGVPAPGGAACAPSVNVSVQTPAGGQGVILQTAQTTGAARITVDLNGDGHPDYNGPATLPLLKIALPTTTQAHIGVTAIGACGATSATTVQPRVVGTGLPATQMGPRIVAAATPALLTPAPLRATCTQGAIVEGIIDARGCFVQVKSPSVLPASAAAVVARYYKDPVIPFWVTAFCKAEQSKTGKTVQCDKFKATYSDQPIYVGTGVVHLNGLTINPGSGLVILYPDQFRVVAPHATVKLGSITLKSGEIDFDVSNLYKVTGKPKIPGNVNGQTRPVLTFDPRKGLPDVGGFPLNAGAELAFKSFDGVHESLVTVHVMLPPVFQVFGPGPQPSAAGGAVATNDQPLHLDTLDISIPHASIGGIGLDQLAFHYAAAGDRAANCSRKYWHATAQIHLGKGPDGAPGAGFILSPPPIQNGVAFCAGSFKSAGGQIQFGFPIPPPQLFPGVLLNDINFAIQLNPTVIRGGGTISAVDLTKVSGTLLAAFATPWAPYTLTKADAGVNLQDIAPRTFTSTTFALGGSLSINVPEIGVLDIGHGAMMYSYPDYLLAAARGDFQLGIFVFHGGLGAQFNARTRLFEADINASICLRGVKIACAGGLGVVSSKGIVACLKFGPLHPGVGLGTNLRYEVWLFDGCKPSHYWVRNIAAAAVGDVSFTVAPGETVKNLRLEGRGGAPKVLVTGPGGETLSLGEDGLTRNGVLVGLRSDQFGATFIGVGNGKPGRYTITALPGSVPLGPLSETRPGYDTNFSGSVTGHGGDLTLHYDARKRGGGQKVTFYEDGKNVSHALGSSSGGKGTLHFTPAVGAGGTRTIVARATVDGTPIPSQVIARFHFAGTGRTGTPHKLTVRRSGTALIINWSPVAAAVRYGVVVNYSGGTQKQVTVSARRHSLRVAAFPFTEGGQVSVSALGPLGDWGRAARSQPVRATKAATTIFLARTRRRKA